MIDQLISELNQEVDKKLNLVNQTVTKSKKDNLILKDKIIFF